MSKPISGYFIGTIGSKSASKNSSLLSDNSAIIATERFDLREHPTKYEQLSSKKLKLLREKEASRTLTKAEYKHKEWQGRLNNRCKKGIDLFWEYKAEPIINNLPNTRNWSA